MDAQAETSFSPGVNLLLLRMKLIKLTKGIQRDQICGSTSSLDSRTSESVSSGSAASPLSRLKLTTHAFRILASGSSQTPGLVDPAAWFCLSPSSTVFLHIHTPEQFT